MNSEEIEVSKQSLLRAIESSGRKYMSESPTFKFDLLSTFDFGLLKMNSYEKKAYVKYVKQKFAPVLVKKTKSCGYEVFAAKSIKMRTILFVYVGDVFSLRQIIEKNMRSDSVFELSHGYDSETTFMVIPDKFTNIGRYLNHSIDGNCKIIRRLDPFNGQPVLIGYSICNINVGDRIRYNYNGSIEKGYPTDTFT
jgi:hypothetical protein